MRGFMKRCVSGIVSLRPAGFRRTRWLRAWCAAAAADVAGLGVIAAATPAMAGAPAPISLTSAQCPANISAVEIDGCVTQLQQLLNGARLVRRQDLVHLGRRPRFEAGPVDRHVRG